MRWMRTCLCSSAGTSRSLVPFGRGCLADGGHVLHLFSPPVIQSTMPRTALFVYVTLAVTFLSYARFCTLVIGDITNYLGIACFTVRKKNRAGEWVEVDVKKQ